MARNVRLPIGIENFEEIRTGDFYYVDKTGLIAELLQNLGKVNLFTRPRRFGKSLNMSMLKYFFGYGCDKSLFDGLEIADETELCREHLGKYPVISISLIRNLFSQALKSNDSLAFAVLTGCLRVSRESIFTGMNNLNVFSITNLECDEHFGFTDREVRAMAEYYGCSDRYSLIKEWYDGYRFGNTDIYCPWDVINYMFLLRNDPNAYPKAFWINTSGNDIIRNFIHMAKAGTRKELERLVNGEAIPRKINQELTYRDLYASIDNLWSVLFTTGYLTQRDSGGYSQPENAYRHSEDIYQQPEDVIWLAIPNHEIRQIFIDQIMEWFQQEARKDTPKLDAFCKAFHDGETEEAQALFNAYLGKVISIRDTNVRSAKKENFYHGILLGLLSHQEDWYIRSNVESGDKGILTNALYSDILIEIEEEGIGIIIEVKYPDDSKNIPDMADLEKGCRDALEQIELRHYEELLRQEGLETILKYGVACNRKKCRVLKQASYTL